MPIRRGPCSTARNTNIEAGVGEPVGLIIDAGSVCIGARNAAAAHAAKPKQATRNFFMATLTQLNFSSPAPKIMHNLASCGGRGQKCPRVALLSDPWSVGGFKFNETNALSGFW